MSEPVMTRDEAVEIAKRFVGKKIASHPLVNVVFLSKSQTLHPHLGRDRWFVTFHERADGKWVRDPGTITVEINPETGKATRAFDL